jgi:hypothetical protein
MLIKFFLVAAVSSFAGGTSDSAFASVPGVSGSTPPVSIGGNAVVAGDVHTQAIYVHPLITLFTSSISSVPTEVFVTYERELERARSVTIQPLIAFGSVQGSTPAGAPVPPPKMDVFALGANVGYRDYWNGKVAHGGYLGPVVEFGYATASRPMENFPGGTYLSGKATAFGVGAIGVVGYRGKWNGFTMFADIGIGGQFTSVSGTGGNPGVSDNGLLIDANLGFGIPF